MNVMGKTFKVVEGWGLERRCNSCDGDGIFASSSRILLGRYHLNLEKGESVKAVFCSETIEGC